MAKTSSVAEGSAETEEIKAVTAGVLASAYETLKKEVAKTAEEVNANMV